MISNHGREIGTMLDDLTWADLAAANEALRLSVSTHPADATCECPAMEALAVLYERGYRLVKT